ncbi:MAG: DHHA1 domain-containing protein, partial [Pyrinomonadaceae bacterium]
AMQTAITARAIAELELNEGYDAPVAIVAGDNWHRGVIGLAASKIVERLNRPAIVISLDDDGLGHGSARSTDNFHLLDAMTACADLFESFGGHAHAAGLSIRRENVAELRRRLCELAAGTLREDDFVPVVRIDTEVNADALSLELFDDLCALEPFGAGWPRPVFVTRDLRVVGEPRVIKERHLKLRVAGTDGRVHEAIWWSGVEECATTPRPGERIELAYTIETNTWQGTTKLQLVVEDLKGSES